MFGNPLVRRLLLEIVSALAVVEAAVLLFMPSIAPELSVLQVIAVHGTALVGIVVPFGFWRRRRLFVGAARLGDRLGTAVGFGILLLGVPASVWVSVMMGREIERTAVGEFEAEMREVVEQVRSISSRPVYGLKGVKGLYAASVDVSRREFSDYVASQTLSGVFPGVASIGFAARVTPDQVEGFTERQRADGVPDFTVWSSAHPYALRWVVQYTELGEAPHELLGFDFGSVPAAHEAFERAVTGDEPALSQAFAMPWATESADTLIWAVPVYANGRATGTMDERWEANLGVVFCTFSLNGMEPVVSEVLGSLARLDLFEGGAASEGGRLMLSTGTPAAERARELSESIELGGVRWAVMLRSTRLFESGIDRTTPGVVAASGVAVMLLACGFVLNLGRSRERAIELAEKMTGEVRRLSLVAERTSNAVIITDGDQHITWVNDGFTRITGYARDEVVGRRPGDILQCENTDPQTRTQIRESLRQGKGFRGEIINRSKFGREYWLDLDIQPVLDGTGHATAYIAVESDLTHQKSVERELLDAKSTAEAANEAKGRFLAGMSHEIRTPLNGIIGFADLLRRGADEGDPAKRAEWIGIIHSSGRHLLRLLNDVLDLSKLDADKMDISIAPCAPVQVITESVALLKSRAQEKGIALEVVSEADVPSAIRSDATRLRQVMMNLVANAVKFTEEGGVTVHISSVALSGREPVLRVDVHDTGIGMSPEQLGQVFRPFQQADKTITQKFGGTGLGLVLARQIIQRLDGDITVTSRLGIGSVFSVEIPATPLAEGERIDTDAPDSSQPGDLLAGRPLDGVRVLVADDVDANRKVCSIFLSRAGAAVRLATNGREVVAACEQEEFDLILMDVQMPEMSGIEATRRIRAAGRTMPVLALTAFSSGADRDECLASGMQDFLAKPIEPSLLIQVSARWTMSSRSPSTPKTPRPVIDPELLPVVRSWLSDLSGQLDEAERALVRGDAERAARVGHSIKGSGGTLGLPEFTRPGEALEDAGRRGDGPAAQYQIGLLRELQSVAAQCLAA